ncbi:MAG: hypothetical protein KIT81_11160 [Alphaproteobacteria bacterium]|nr:hypothetical protein [Alphaproteobacteria bacterium]
MRLPPAHALALLALLALAGCGSGEPATPPGGWPEIRAGFQPGSAAQVIELLVVDPLPLDGAELIWPDGRVVPSDPIAIIAPGVASGSYSGGGVGVGVGVVGGSASRTSTGIGISLPIFGFGSAADRPSTYESRTRFLVPDMQAYRAGWPSWRIRLRLGNPMQTTPRYHLIAAPPPPA